FYQRAAGGPVSRSHLWLFSGAIYAPMVAALFLYSHLAPEKYEGESYRGLDVGAPIAWGLGLVALGWVLAYFCWTWKRKHKLSASVHPGEVWIVIAHVVAFGSAYVLGPAQASFLLVLTVHHELQYIYFTWAIARWPVGAGQPQIFPRKSGGSEIRF